MPMRCSRVSGLCVAVLTLIAAPAAHGFGIFSATGNGLGGGTRWDAQARTFDGYERSLKGGLRYSIEGGSWLAFRDEFTWDATPTRKQFAQAVKQSFSAWTITDPATGLGTNVRFVQNFGTPVDNRIVAGIRYGAEIDLFASIDTSSWDPGNSQRQAITNLSSIKDGRKIKLTSGTTGYGGYAITGADITLNSNPEAEWTLDWFRLALTHEIGHALGLDDVDVDSGPNGRFIDDNFQLDKPWTLKNKFAKLVNARRPSQSTKLKLFTVPNDGHGFEAANVHLLMESNIDSALLSMYPYLTSDEFAGRQFLYPYKPGVTLSTLSRNGIVFAAPEPATVALLPCAALWFGRRLRRA